MSSRFFSLGEGRVGQYLSDRVLVVRTPFRRSQFRFGASEICVFGFSDLRSARRFTQSLAARSIPFSLQAGEVMTWPLEVRVWGHLDLAKRLAGRDRLDARQRPLPASLAA
ncbi:hypothetical protein [Leptolyngbya sp. FACHB-261]|uniref:hypothetical protein n=1 Tax=Leptolyngbya sp. FACHB-261 TaxID=2692806 RepID=UPI001682509F|nr:hypothetical protein [Leptolyngbya sp. FACHB-261]MBD2100141.1 hypothetical protein [Leptolyngbya sp. FACHB-261]